MSVLRSRLDRRSRINRRFLNLTVSRERRSGERRLPVERRQAWVRTSKWSSMDLDLGNKFYWGRLNPDQ